MTDDVGPAPDPHVGKTLGGRYVIRRKLGGGGMGAVYEAEHTLVGKRVAIKLLHAQFASDAGVVKRFLNEARAAATIGHPNILDCNDMGQTADGAPFLVLELLEGMSLDEALEREGPFTLARTVPIMAQIAGALGAAHAKGIVHRDLKPENVFLVDRPDRKDFAKVLDFGISKFTDAGLTGPGTATGSVLGTPYYMAPEQLKDASRVDQRADVYAAGAIVYECLSGRTPFRASTLPELLMMISAEEPPPLGSLREDLPPELCAIVHRALAKDPDARFDSMASFAAALEPYRGDETEPQLTDVGFAETVQADSQASLTGSDGGGRRRWLAIAAVLVVGGGAAALAVAFGGESGPAPAEPTPLAVAPPDAGAPTEPDASQGPADVQLFVDSPHRGARVVWEGEHRAVPFEQRIEEGDEPITFEVRAPGRQGRRYAVAPDATHTLWVELDRGRGIRDAEPSELAAALAGVSEQVEEPTAGGRRRTRRRASRGAAAGSAPTMESAPAAMESAPAAMESAPAAMETPMVTPMVTAPTPMATMRRSDGVYVGPSGDIPDEI